MATDDFATLYRTHFDQALKLAVVLAGTREEAEDAVQDTFAKLYVRIRTRRPPDHVWGWLRVVLARTIRRKMRFQRKVITSGQGMRDPEPGWDLWRAVQDLPTNQRIIVGLHYYEDRPISEIADALGMRDSTARVHLHRARRRLAEALGEVNSDVAR